MTVEEWYRRATALPFVVTVVAWFLAASSYPQAKMTTVAMIGWLIGVVGIYAAVRDGAR